MLHHRDGSWWLSFPSKPMLGADGTALRDERGKIRYSAALVSIARQDARERFKQEVLDALRLAQPQVFAETEATSSAIVPPSEIFEPGRSFRVDVNSGQTEVLEPADASAAPHTAPTLLDMALALAATGMPVFPCNADKRPPSPRAATASTTPAPIPTGSANSGTSPAPPRN